VPLLVEIWMLCGMLELYEWRDFIYTQLITSSAIHMHLEFVGKRLHACVLLCSGASIAYISKVDVIRVFLEELWMNALAVLPKTTKPPLPLRYSSIRPVHHVDEAVRRRATFSVSGVAWAQYDDAGLVEAEDVGDTKRLKAE
jgi:hypothetical protein